MAGLLHGGRGRVPIAPGGLLDDDPLEQQPQPAGFFERINDNSNALMLMGLGGLSGQGNADAFGKMLQGWQAGSRLDLHGREIADERLEKQQAAAEKAQQRNVTAALLVKQGVVRDEAEAMQYIHAGLAGDLLKQAFQKEKAPTTDDMREYSFYTQQERAAGREPRPFFEFLGRGGDRGLQIPSGYMPDPENPGRLAPIPGGPAEALPVEAAGRVAALNVAKNNLGEAKRILQSYTLSERVGSALGRGEGGQARRVIRLGVEAALRAMTGAAAPEEEIARYTDMFAPGPTDLPADTQRKLQLLDEFTGELDAALMRGRGGASAPQGTPVAPPASPGNLQPVAPGRYRWNG
jgi:hypothetical protein